MKKKKKLSIIANKANFTSTIKLTYRTIQNDLDNVTYSRQMLELCKTKSGNLHVSKISFLLQILTKPKPFLERLLYFKLADFYFMNILSAFCVQ